eukprot:scaffold79979_cov46-Phaeocystis_antarctica.AAC.1
MGGARAASAPATPPRGRARPPSALGWPAPPVQGKARTLFEPCVAYRLGRRRAVAAVRACCRAGLRLLVECEAEAGGATRCHALSVLRRHGFACPSRQSTVGAGDPPSQPVPMAHAEAELLDVVRAERLIQSKGILQSKGVAGQGYREMKGLVAGVCEGVSRHHGTLTLTSSLRPSGLSACRSSIERMSFFASAPRVDASSPPSSDVRLASRWYRGLAAIATRAAKLKVALRLLLSGPAHKRLGRSSVFLTRRPAFAPRQTSPRRRPIPRRSSRCTPCCWATRTRRPSPRRRWCPTTPPT